eukprot:1065841-Rhodomonas_salina.1
MLRFQALLRAVIALLLISVAQCYRLEITRQPIGNILKGRQLQQQPAIRVVLTELEEIGFLDLSPPAAQAMIAEMERGSVVDVKNNGVVMITLESNPTGSDLRGRGVQVPMNLKNGQAELTDLA